MTQGSHPVRLICLAVFSGLSVSAIGAPDILWQNRGSTNCCSLWQMNGGTLVSSTMIHDSAGTPLPNPGADWKIVGYADFNGDQIKDILWRRQSSDHTYVWYLSGADKLTWQTGASDQMMHFPGVAWKIMGVGDFDGDGKSDIAWQNDVIGQKAVWLMNGLSLKPNGAAVIDSTTGSQWQIRAVGEFNINVPPTSRRDDLVLQNVVTRQLAIWFMNGTAFASPGQVVNPTPDDVDFRVVNAADFNGDGKTDLMFRHVANGRNIVWVMNGSNFVSPLYLKPETDLSHKVANQDWAESTWRQEDPAHSRISVSVSAGKATLTYRFPAGFHARIRRREIKPNDEPNAGWPPTDSISNLAASSWTDPVTLDAGKLYEYEVQNQDSPNQILFVSTGTALPDSRFDNRGKILLLVDRALVALNHAGFNSALDTFVQDLAGDGWTVERFKDESDHLDAYRHDDALIPASTATPCSPDPCPPPPNFGCQCLKGGPTDLVTDPAADMKNAANESKIKAWIDARAASAKGVVIIGHVTVPFSGNQFVDGHQNHQGSWVADTYYGDKQADWENNLTSFATCTVHTGDAQFCTPAWNRNRPGDHRHDKNQTPGWQELFVGRIDFSRLPSFGTGDTALPAEAELFVRYLVKNHEYRHGIRKLNPKAICYTGFNVAFPDDFRLGDFSRQFYGNAIRNSAALWGTSVSNLVIGWPLHQRSESYTWGFAAAPSGEYLIAVQPNFAPPEGMFFMRSTSELSNPAHEPQIGFHVLLGSMFGDYYFNDNVMRGLLATPLYNYAALYSRYTQWQFHQMAYGECLGVSALATMNRTYLPTARPLSPDVFAYSAIVGDPTLHINVVPAPLISRRPGTASSTVILDITPRYLGDMGDKYYVYRYEGTMPTASTATPAFTLLAGPTNSPFQSVVDPLKHYVYLVKAARPMPSGGGTHTILSQGTYLSL